MADGRVLREACASIGGSLCHDLPPAALLRKPELWSGLLSLLVRALPSTRPASLTFTIT